MDGDVSKSETAKVPRSQKTTRFELTERDYIGALIQYLRQRGIHAPDYDKASWTLFHRNYPTVDANEVHVSWTEDLPE